MMGISFQLLDTDKCDSLVRFLHEVDADFPIPLSQKVDLNAWAARVLKSGFAFAAVQEGHIVGVAAGYANDVAWRKGFLSVLAVASDARGRGIGETLVAKFEREAALRGMERISLTTHLSNIAARRLYSRMNYTTDNKLDSMGNLTYSKRVIWLTEDRPNILLSSAGRRTYLVEWFREALDGRGLVHASNSDAAATSLAAADRGVVTPLIYSDEYIPFMLAYCEREHIGAIIPLFDVDIPVLAAHRAEFESIGCFPVVAPAEFAIACSDKLASHDILSAAGIRCPDTYVGARNYESAVERGDASYPAFIKPRWGMGSIGLAEAADDEELRVLCGAVERKVRESYLRYESAVDEPGRSVIVQPKVDAVEYGMDVYCNLSGHYRGCVVRRKVAMRAGETDIAEVVVADARFESLARSLAELSQHPGCMDVDVFDVDGELMVLEMNARFGGGYPFSHSAGADMPRALVSWLHGEEPEPDAFAVELPGVYMKDMRIVRVQGSSQC